MEWTKDDLKTLRRLFGNSPTGDVANALRRPVECVKKKASRLGLKKSKKYLRSLGRAAVIVLALLLFAVPARADLFTLEGAFDYETSEAGFLWWPDPNGGVGIAALMDSHIPGDPEDNIAVGVTVEFNLTGLYDTIWGTVLPGEWVPSDAGVATPFGKLGLLFETNEDHEAIFVAATGWRFLPGRRIQPTIWTEYIRPESSSSVEQDLKIMFGATIWLGDN